MTMLPLGTMESPELVIGLLGRIGLDTRMVSKKIKSTLSLFNYDVEMIKVTELLPDLAALPEILDHPTEVYYNSRISACNKLREIAEQSDIFACLAIIRIMELRGGEPPRKRIAYIVDQIKRPEESALLRQVYRDLFIQISCHAPRSTRERRLARKIADSHPDNPREENWRAEAARLIGQDDAEEDMTFGQRVREAFPLGDMIVDASDEVILEKELVCFFEIFFGHPTRSPTRDEYGMALAYNASLRSIDMSRQVGAAIISGNGETLALGCNEVPKAGGGTYWEGDTGDARDAALGTDQNTYRKRLMVTDVVYRLSKAGLMDGKFAKSSVDRIEAELIDRSDAPLKDCLILDSSEFGRMLHAEMCAITEGGRIGIGMKDAHLYCTAFPCHNCAKHIVGVGIEKVIYLEPYPKSHVSELYPDSIEVDPASHGGGKIPFRQYVGLTPARFYFFSKERLKDATGRIKPWSKETANPVSRQVIPQHPELEKFALDTFKPALARLSSAQTREDALKTAE